MCHIRDSTSQQCILLRPRNLSIPLRIPQPLPKPRPRTPHIPKPRPFLQPSIRIPRRHSCLFHHPSFFAFFQCPGPFAPLDWFEIGAGEDDADAEEEDGEEGFESYVGGEILLGVGLAG